jgi:hypothetical protein
MKKCLPFSALSFLLLLTTTLDGHALSPRLTKEELILNSQDIIHGIVKKVKSSWDENHTTIYTYITLEVLDVFKGDPRDQVVVQTEGGTIPDTTKRDTTDSLHSLPGIHVDSDGKMHFRPGSGGISLDVEDSPELEVGMEVIIHTFSYQNGSLGIYGMAYGAYVINYGGQEGLYIINNGAIRKLDVTLDQFGNLVDELISQEE